MIGTRINGVRIYTAHLKQLSAHPREVISIQLDEIRIQFQNGTHYGEGVIMIFDANVHVGNAINGDKQDWAGRLLLDMVCEENLTLLNATDLCKGVITRVDPRNQKGSTIDLAICNQFLLGNIRSMLIDESEEFKPLNYLGSKTTKTDHNTVVVKLMMEIPKKVQKQQYINYKNESECEMFRTIIEQSYIPTEMNMRLDVDNVFHSFMKVWDNAIAKSFKKITPRGPQASGVTKSVRELMKKEKWIRKNTLHNPERGRRIAEVRVQIKGEIEKNLASKCHEKVQ